MLTFAIGLLAFSHGVAKSYERLLSLNDCSNSPQIKTVFVLFIAIYTPFCMLVVFSECDDDGVAFLALMAIPVWIAGWLIWLYRQTQKA